MLSKARLLVPTLLIVATLAGSAYAAFLVGTFTGSTNVVENIHLSTTSQTVPDIFPNGNAAFSFSVSNTGSVDQNIQLDVALSAPAGTCLSAFSVDGHTVSLSACASASAPGVVPLGGSVSVSITVHAAGDAAPGSVTVSVNVSRTA